MISAATFMAAIVEPGIAPLDASLGQLLPDIFGGDNRYRQSTPRMIMSHTAGFPGLAFSFTVTQCFQTYYAGSENPFFANETNVTLEGCVRQLAISRPAHPPGSHFEYSDLAYEVIALLVQRLANLSFEDAFKKYIGGPLEMNSSSYECSVAGSTAAHSHPGVGLCTTANDLSKFTQVMFRRGRAYDGGSVLAAGSVDEMLSEQTRNAILYNDSFNIFTEAWARTRCVANTLPGNASLVGYGFG